MNLDVPFARLNSLLRTTGALRLNSNLMATRLNGSALANLSRVSVVAVTGDAVNFPSVGDGTATSEDSAPPTLRESMETVTLKVLSDSLESAALTNVVFSTALASPDLCIKARLLRFMSTATVGKPACARCTAKEPMLDPRSRKPIPATTRHLDCLGLTKRLTILTSNVHGQCWWPGLLYLVQENDTASCIQ